MANSILGPVTKFVSLMNIKFVCLCMLGNQYQHHPEYQFSYLQQEYIRGISAWNFNLEDLKNQAALVSNVRLCLLIFFPVMKIN